jgi:hypothetical protein
MIERYSFGSITVDGRLYSSDLKIIGNRVIADWWRQSGHVVDVDDVRDILAAGAEVVVFGTGSSGLMRVEDRLRAELEARGITLVAEPTAAAVDIFNRLLAEGRDVAAGFHLTC